MTDKKRKIKQDSEEMIEDSGFMDENGESENGIGDQESKTGLSGNDKEAEGPEDSADAENELEKKLQAAQAEAKENHDRLLRVSAEFENFKKRSLREMDEFRKFANEALIREMLCVVDNLERAIHSVDKNGDAINSIIEGVDMTLKEILKIFERFGISRIECVAKPFDPNFHQAVMREESKDHKDNTVIKELQKGYMLHDRLLRPAMVSVSVTPPKNDTEPKEGLE